MQVEPKDGLTKYEAAIFRHHTEDSDQLSDPTEDVKKNGRLNKDVQATGSINLLLYRYCDRALSLLLSYARQ